MCGGASMATDLQARSEPAAAGPPRRPWSLYVSASLTGLFGLLLIGFGWEDDPVMASVLGGTLLLVAVLLVWLRRVGWWVAVVVGALLLAIGLSELAKSPAGSDLIVLAFL